VRPGSRAVCLAAFDATYAAVRSFSLAGVGVAVDVGHHDRYSRSLGILGRCARHLADLPVLFVGVRCSLDDLVARRKTTWDQEPDLAAVERIRAWEEQSIGPGSTRSRWTRHSCPPMLACASSSVASPRVQPRPSRQLRAWDRLDGAHASLDGR
jgi:hypothetical protein